MGKYIKITTYINLCNPSVCECDGGRDWSLSVESSRGRLGSKWPPIWGIIVGCIVRCNPDWGDGVRVFGS